MIQKFNLDINTIFKNKSVNYLNPLSADEFKDFVSYLSVHLETFDRHCHNDELCKSPNLKKVLSYSRNYITFTDHKVNEGTVEVPVFYCSNDGHYHSLLPLDTIVPYCQYSLSFILCAVFDKLYSLLTIEEIVYKYSISKSTIYRWVEKYSIYIRLYYRLKHKYRSGMFISVRYLFGDLLNDIFDICDRTLFQHSRKLFHLHKRKT